jgi:hypothetical protein
VIQHPSLARYFSSCKRYRDDEFFHSAMSLLSSLIIIYSSPAREKIFIPLGANEGNLLPKLVNAFGVSVLKPLQFY